MNQEFSTTDLFHIRTALEGTINRLNARYEAEEEVALPQVVAQFQETLDRVNAALTLEGVA